MKGVLFFYYTCLPEQIIYRERYSGTYKQSAQDVGGVVHTEIDSCIAVEKGP